MAIETDITKLVFNKMSQEKYEELKAKGELVNNEFYITPDSNIDIDIPENVVEADNYVNAKLWKGTLAEYEALESYDDSVTYIITDDVVEGGTIVSIDAYTKSETDEFLNAKQDVLVSGTNIKTINGESILGEGDYVIDVDTSEIENNINTLNNEITTVKTDLNNKLDTTQITNCITEIPQDIKLEINSDGKGVLKSGSKVYIPNGFEENGTTLKFDEYVVSSDVIFNFDSSQTDTYFLALTSNGNGGWSKVNLAGSGTSTDTTDSFYYRTNENKIWYKNNDLDTATYSFPIGVVNITDGIGVINQVFNGFGYIGNTIFALTGVKGLIPNGRNEDGSLKNIETTVNKVTVLTFGSNVNTPYNGRFLLNSNGEIFARVGGYDSERNYITASDGISILIGCSFTEGCLVESGVIKTFNSKLPFRAVDHNDKKTIVNWFMPNYSKAIDVTFVPSGTWTAPSDGYVIGYCYKGGSFGLVINEDRTFYIVRITNNVEDFSSFNVPVVGGQTYYMEGAGTHQFKFVPCRCI